MNIQELHKYLLERQDEEEEKPLQEENSEVDITIVDFYDIPYYLVALKLKEKMQ